MIVARRSAMAVGPAAAGACLLFASLAHSAVVKQRQLSPGLAPSTLPTVTLVSVEVPALGVVSVEVPALGVVAPLSHRSVVSGTLVASSPVATPVSSIALVPSIVPVPSASVVTAAGSVTSVVTQVPPQVAAATAELVPLPGAKGNLSSDNNIRTNLAVAGAKSIQAAGTSASWPSLPLTKKNLQKVADIAGENSINQVSIVFGLILFAVALAVQWLNERRTVKLDALLAGGLEECVSVSGEKADPINRGRLVHVQGRTHGAVPITDQQFSAATVRNCLKLQSTIEAFEWVPAESARRMPANGRRPSKRTMDEQFRAEWTTTHHDLSRMRKPCPENPPAILGLTLGTFTRVCDRVQLGSFVLTEEMVTQFHRFEPGMQHLPSRLTSHGLTFVANPEDGYYYARPGFKPAQGGSWMWSSLLSQHQVGDMRARFMVVPEGDATVVAMQCRRGGDETFAPYRAVPRSPCTSRERGRELQIEEGSRTAKEVNRTDCSLGCIPVPAAVGSCFCCPVNSMAICCDQEVVTEEVFFVSNALVPRDKPFQLVVGRSQFRVVSLRLLGWGTMFLGLWLILGPYASLLRSSPHLSALFGGHPVVGFSVLMTVALSVFVVAAAYLPYRPIMTLKWLILVTVVLGVPFVWSMLAAQNHAAAKKYG